MKKILILVLISAGLFGLYAGYKVLSTAASFKSKLLCDEVFIANRDMNEALKSDIHSDSFWYLEYFKSEISYDPNLVTSSFFGLVDGIALHRKGLGCTTVKFATVDDLLRKRKDVQYYNQEIIKDLDGGIKLSKNKYLNVNFNKLDSVVDEAFIDPDTEKLRRTRGLLVQYKGDVIAEKYADGFDANTRFNGWSMTKSVMNTLVGILVKQSKVSVDEGSLFSQWSIDGRSEITIENLLYMNSGLKFGEDYANPLGNAVQMLFNSYSTADFAINMPLKNNVGDVWYYSSGTSNIISKVIKNELGTDQRYIDFVYKDLFAKLGMSSALIDQDSSGTFIGSSFMHATARDWAKLGQLYLQKGVWNGEQILPEGWVDYSLKPVPDSNGEYASHIWLKSPKSYAAKDADFSVIPEDTYFFIGYQGQIVTIIPSYDLVIVRFGLTRSSHSWHHPSFIADILASIGDSDS